MKHTRILALLLAFALLLPGGKVRAAAEEPSAGTVDEIAAGQPAAGETAGESGEEAAAEGADTAAVGEEPAPAELFSDFAAEHWAYSAVSRLVGLGVINGYPDGTFRPDDNVTLGEFVKMLATAFYPYSIPEANPKQSGPWWWQLMWSTGDFSLFRDMDMYSSIIGLMGTAYTEAYYYSEAGKWMNGMLSRQEMALLMYNVIRNTSTTLPDSQERLRAIDEISDWRTLVDKYRIPVSSCYVLGLLNGIDGAFQGKSGMTRAQAAVVICRLLDAVSRDMLEEKFNRRWQYTISS